jgi:hypothetical protein
MPARPPLGPREITPARSPLTGPTPDRKRERSPSPPAQSAWEDIPTESASANPPPYGMGRRHGAPRKITDNLPTLTGNLSVSTGSALKDVLATTTPSGMNAPAVGLPDMEPNVALSHNLLICRNAALMPYIPSHWHSELLTSGLLARYPMIPRSLVYGFEAGVRVAFVSSCFHSMSLTQVT